MAAFQGRMSEFRPTKASPPARIPRNVRPKSPTDLSFRSEQQLKSLTFQEVDFLDAVFQRAGPHAVGFMAVFEAYNRVLEERGLAPDEVVGYAKLLKVGNWRGETWREKWAEVKSKFGYGTGNGGQARAPQNSGFSSMSPALPEFDQRRRNLLQITREVPFPDDVDVPQYHNTPKIPLREGSPCASEATYDSMETETLARRTRGLIPTSTSRASDIISATSEGNRPSSSAPPSYKTTEREMSTFQVRGADPVEQILRMAIKPKTPLDASTARRTIAAAREKKGSVVNENQAWKKIQMERDEKDAAQFYRDRLVERCWEIWKNGYQWIIVTNGQIDEARNSLILRVAFQRWHRCLTARQLFRERTVQMFNTKRLKCIFGVWVDKLKMKRQEKWRQDMRSRLKVVRGRQESRIQREAWFKWLHVYRLHFATHRYHGYLMVAFFKRWKSRVSYAGQLEVHADEVAQRRMYQIVVLSWARWKHALDLSLSEKAFTRQTNLKTLRNSMAVWRKRSNAFQVAESFHDFALMKSTIRSWKAARDRILFMYDKADKRAARRDGILLRAVLRVWKAQERGTLLERVIHLRYLRNSFTAWKKRLRDRSHDEEMADLFARRPQSSTLVSALRIWQRGFTAHRKINVYAAQHHATQLSDRALLTWRLALRERLKSAKLARIADRFFTTRSAWKSWRFQVGEKQREGLLKQFRNDKMKRWFSRWLHRTEQERTRRISEQTIQDMVVKRIAQNALERWTTAVIEIKLRELEVSQQYNLSIQTSSFKKWKALCIRHAEELGLMESYQYVKREEHLRRFFHRWLAATRTTRRRRITLREKEEQFDSMLILRAWDKWRDRFVEEKLRVLEHGFTLQGRRNLIFRTFGVWHSRTKCLPALRFRATQLKTKYFGIWCSALPGALQAKTAREVHQTAVLSKFMNQWTENYRAKVALKAVARARYLRLPTAAPRLNNNAVRTGLPNVAPLNTFHSRHARIDNQEDGPSPSISVLLSRPSSRKPNTGALFRARAHRDSSPTGTSASYQRHREISPARSNLSVPTKLVQEPSTPKSLTTTQDGEKRGRLWLELREVQRRTKLFAKRDDA